jgi:hypothetical protein
LTESSLLKKKEEYEEGATFFHFMMKGIEEFDPRRSGAKLKLVN